MKLISHRLAVSIYCAGSIFGYVFFGITPAYADGKYVVTAYYSPLPEQEYYLTGTYEAERILNGHGVRGASGKGVFSGMLAAPANYPFGTKIYLEGLGIGEVADRGGAIVNAGKRGYSSDRIDVWMGYGDEGLRRANFWGKRTVAGYPVDSTSAVTINTASVPAPLWATVNLKKAYVAPVKVQGVFDVNLGAGSDASLVENLQSILEEIGFLSSDYSAGVYDQPTHDAVYAFQIARGIVTSESDAGAGYFGPKTRASLQEYYSQYTTYIDELESDMTDVVISAQERLDTIGTVNYGDVSPQVRELQKILAELGFFNVADTAIFGPQTKSSIISYQLDRGIIASESDVGAGIFGPQTRESVLRDLSRMNIQALKADETETFHPLRPE